jgi:tRNA threonylcarbamoyladenosine biosynthesis protein TsaB
MKVLGFDTATDDTVVASTDGERTAFERVLPPAKRPVHSQALLGLAEEAVQALGGWSEVDRIAVGIGPGTFTGIRIGVATAAGLAASSRTPAVGVPTLAALARSIGDATGADLVMPLLDARRGEAFGGLHDGEGSALEDPFVCGPEELVERLRGAAERDAAPFVAGPGAVRFRDQLLRAGLETEPDGSSVHRLTGRSICQLGALAEKTGPETLEPLYLRVPDAQLWLERDGKKI